MSENYLKIKAVLKFDNYEENLSVKIISLYKESFHYVGQLLEDSKIIDIAKDSLVVLRYDDIVREFYILGLVDEILEDEKINEEIEKRCMSELLFKDVSNNFNDKEEFIMLKKYLLNNKPNLKDAKRQMIVISGKNLKYEYPDIKEKYDLNDEERNICKKIGLPYDFEEELDDEAFFENLIMVDDALRSSKSREDKRILSGLIDKLAPIVPEEEVKEIHLYDPIEDKTKCIFLDEAGVYEIVSKKAKLYFNDGETVVGYVGSDFEIYGQDCICIFESYDKERGFYNYNYYLLDDLKLVEAIENTVPRYKENINFDFEI